MKDFIAPSILSADFANLGKDVSDVLEAGSDIIHFDVMDNNFVPNLSFGAPICKALRDYGITAPIDVHLMVSSVDNLIVDFAKAGATYITFHPESSIHIDRSIELIKSLGCKAGLALNPATPLSTLDYTLEKLDMVLLMSVNPGFGGQSFIDHTFDKITKVRQMIDKTGKNIRLEVDGGIKIDNIGKVKQAGADTFVAGSAIFGTNDYKKVIDEMRNQLA